MKDRIEELRTIKIDLTRQFNDRLDKIYSDKIYGIKIIKCASIIETNYKLHEIRNLYFYVVDLINSYKVKELKKILQDSYQLPFDVYIGFCGHIHSLIQIYE